MVDEAAVRGMRTCSRTGLSWELRRFGCGEHLAPPPMAMPETGQTELVDMTDIRNDIPLGQNGQGNEAQAIVASSGRRQINKKDPMPPTRLSKHKCVNGKVLATYVSQFSGKRGSQKLGQPVPESYFVSEEKRGRQQPAHTNIPSSLRSKYSF